MMIWVTGADGQVGRSLRALLEWRGAEGYLFLNRAMLDITSEASIRALASTNPPGCIINLAAYTDVNGAESDIDGAYRVNATAVKYLAEVAEEYGAVLIQISTDYVFDGSKDGPYVETDEPNPLNVYGRSKLLGETFALALCSRCVVVRTSWVFAGYGVNFVTRIMNLLRDRSELSVVDDQVGGPTSAESIANLLCWLVDKKVVGDGFDAWGLYHFCQEPYISRYGFARVIQDALINQRDNICQLMPCRSCDLPQPSRRPLNSALGCAKFRVLGFEYDSWLDDLSSILGHWEGRRTVAN